MSDIPFPDLIAAARADAHADLERLGGMHPAQIDYLANIGRVLDPSTVDKECDMEERIEWQ